MIRSIRARRLTGLTVLFVGLLISFSALSFAAQGSSGPALASLAVGLLVCSGAVWWLFRLPVDSRDGRAEDPAP